MTSSVDRRVTQYNIATLVFCGQKGDTIQHSELGVLWTEGDVFTTQHSDIYRTETFTEQSIATLVFYAENSGVTRT